MPIDRHLTSELLGFKAPTENAMDTVSDRDYSLEFLSDASISMMHLSRWAESSHGGILLSFLILPLMTASVREAALCRRRRTRIAELSVEKWVVYTEI